jgi:hypothetical protein
MRVSCLCSDDHPTKVLELAVRGMLPKNKLRNRRLERLHLYAGEVSPPCLLPRSFTRYVSDSVGRIVTQQALAWLLTVYVCVCVCVWLCGVGEPPRRRCIRRDSTPATGRYKNGDPTQHLAGKCRRPSLPWRNVPFPRSILLSQVYPCSFAAPCDFRFSRAD